MSASCKASPGMMSSRRAAAEERHLNRLAKSNTKKGGAPIRKNAGGNRGPIRSKSYYDELTKILKNIEDDGSVTSASLGRHNTGYAPFPKKVSGVGGSMRSKSYDDLTEMLGLDNGRLESEGDVGSVTGDSIAGESTAPKVPRHASAEKRHLTRLVKARSRSYDDLNEMAGKPKVAAKYRYQVVLPPRETNEVRNGTDDTTGVSCTKLEVPKHTLAEVKHLNRIGRSRNRSFDELNKTPGTSNTTTKYRYQVSLPRDAILKAYSPAKVPQKNAQNYPATPKKERSGGVCDLPGSPVDVSDVDVFSLTGNKHGVSGAATTIPSVKSAAAWEVDGILSAEWATVQSRLSKSLMHSTFELPDDPTAVEPQLQSKAPTGNPQAAVKLTLRPRKNGPCPVGKVRAKRGGSGRSDSGSSGSSSSSGSIKSRAVEVGSRRRGVLVCAAAAVLTTIAALTVVRSIQWRTSSGSASVSALTVAWRKPAEAVSPREVAVAELGARLAAEKKSADLAAAAAAKEAARLSEEKSAAEADREAQAVRVARATAAAEAEAQRLLEKEKEAGKRVTASVAAAASAASAANDARRKAEAEVQWRIAEIARKAKAAQRARIEANALAAKQTRLKKEAEKKAAELEAQRLKTQTLMAAESRRRIEKAEAQAAAVREKARLEKEVEAAAAVANEKARIDEEAKVTVAAKKEKARMKKIDKAIKVTDEKTRLQKKTTKKHSGTKETTSSPWAWQLWSRKDKEKEVLGAQESKMDLVVKPATALASIHGRLMRVVEVLRRAIPAFVLLAFIFFAPPLLFV